MSTRPSPSTQARGRRGQVEQRDVYDAFEGKMPRVTKLPDDRDGLPGDLRIVTLDDGRAFLCVKGRKGWRKMEMA